MVMTKDSFPHDSDPSGMSHLTEAEQLAVLQPMLESNMQRLVADRELFLKIKAHYDAMHTSRASQERNDAQLAVHRDYYTLPIENGSVQQVEDLVVGISNHYGEGEDPEITHITVAKRVSRPDGLEIIPVDDFTQEEGEMVCEMVDELMLARQSGQIPDLDERGLDGVVAYKAT